MKLCKCRLHNLENESEETAMERRKLTKEDIDKVRNIEGFPIGTDEDIIALSDAPFYTACPNPFIEDFIKEYGIPYDEATDDYHREPFAADVSEGKTDPIYMAHTYHTKVPHKAIMQYILHYTKPGDLVLDGFCGTGMTGVAAQMCGCPDNDFRYKIEQLNPSVSWGARKAILNDLSPSATFIASNYNAAVDGYDFSEEAHRIVDAAERELGWMYSTHPIQENLLGEKAVINYTLWSDVFYCPHCGKEIVFWNIAIDSDGNMKKELRCDSCGSIIKKSQCARAKDILIDKKSGKTIEISKQVPVLINYSYGGKRYDKVPDAEDIALIEKIKEMDTDKWYPTEEVPYGEKTADPIKAGFNKVNLFYTERNLCALALIWDMAQRSRYKNQIMFCITAVLMKTASKLHNVGMKKGKINLAGAMPNALYIPSILAERNIFTLVRGKIKDKLNEYLSYEIESPTVLRKTREILMNIWVYDNPYSSRLKSEAVQLIEKYPEYAVSINWCMMLAAYPVFLDMCKLIGKMSEFQDEITLAQLKQKLFDEWGERTTLYHSIDKLISTLKEFDVLRCEKPGKYHINRMTVNNEQVSTFMAYAVMNIDDSGYYSFQELNDSVYLFPFEYHVEKETIVSDDRFSISTFGGEISISLT